MEGTYAAKLVALDVLFLLSATEASLVNKLGQFLLHELLNLGNSLLQAFLCRAGNVEIQRRVL